MQKVCVEAQKAVVDLANAGVRISGKLQLLYPQVDEHSGIAEHPQTGLGVVLEVRFNIDIQPQILQLQVDFRCDFAFTFD